MKFAPLAPLAAALLLAACSNNDPAGSAAADGETDSPSAVGSAADASSAKKPATQPKIDPDTPASEFAVLGDATDCLGISWNMGDDEAKDRVRTQYAQMLGGREYDRTTDAFAKKDYMASLEPEIASRVAPYEGKRLYSYTTDVGDDPYREYNFEHKGFFDSSRIIWGGSGRVFSQHEGRGGREAYCYVQFTNGEKWKGPQSQYYVPDEQEARAASAALAARKSAVKVYFHVDDIGKSDTSSNAPQINASMVRIELVDAEGKKLATAVPVKTDEEAAAEKAAASNCFHPIDCM